MSSIRDGRVPSQAGQLACSILPPFPKRILSGRKRTRASSAAKLRIEDRGVGMPVLDDMSAPSGAVALVISPPPFCSSEAAPDVLHDLRQRLSTAPVLDAPAGRAQISGGSHLARCLVLIGARLWEDLVHDRPTCKPLFCLLDRRTPSRTMPACVALTLVFVFFLSRDGQERSTPLRER